MLAKHIDELFEKIGPIKHKKQWIYTYINTGKVKAFVENGEYFLDDVEFNRVIRCKKNKLSLEIVIPEGYITSVEAMNTLQCSYMTTRTLVYKGYIESIPIGQGNIRLLNKEQVEGYLETRNKIQELDNDSDWIKLHSISKTDGSLYQKIMSAISKEKISMDDYKIIMDLGHKLYYIKLSAMELIKNNELKRQVVVKKYKVTTIDDINTLIEKLSGDIKRKTAKKKTIAVAEIVSKLRMDLEELALLISNEQLSSYCVSGNNEISESTMITYDGVEIILKTNNYISLTEFSNCTGISRATLLSLYKKIKDKITVNELEIIDKVFISIDTAYEILMEYSRNSISNSDDIDFIYKERIKFINLPFKETEELIKEYLYYKKEQLKKNARTYNKYDYVREINALEELIDNIDKEIYLYDNDEIIELLCNREFKDSYLNKITIFLNYVNRVKKDECKFTKEMGITLLTQYTKGEERKDVKFDEDTWTKYYVELRNIDNHIEKAFTDVRYAQIWTYCILNLSVTWRRRNIIFSMPNIPLEVVGIYDFDWFKSGNEFTQSMALNILEQVKFSLDGVIAYKNKCNLHFNVPKSLKVATAIALVICEIHRRKAEQEYLLFKLTSTPPKKGDYKILFNNEETLINFGSTKATKSLISYGFANAIHSINTVAIAYKLNVYGRSHKEKPDEITNTTEIYHELSNTYGSVTEFAYQIIEREGFGYLYFKLLKCILDNERFEKLSQDEITEITKTLKRQSTPLMLENISDFIINNKEKSNLNISELVALENIKNSSSNLVESISKKMEEILINNYKEVADVLFPSESPYLKEFIEDKCKEINKNIGKLQECNFNFKDIFEDISRGKRNSCTDYTNCVFDEIEKQEYCPYMKIGAKVETCIGCNYNLMAAYMLYEVSNKLNSVLDYMIERHDLNDFDKLKNTYLIQTYLSIMVQAKVGNEMFDSNYLSAFFNQKEIKSKLVRLKEEKKLLYKNNKDL